ncbi:hypothetical protein CDAR_7711 [Caerostris darwini]|uniref:Uncharacterized protein n=1 Tax=Caerostris darwini TaxID=1538125 RepID=A0AAV4RD17_9ARAC|nr:hypothetical protein CDAR_7711 [Caerostris darwini]
MAIHRFLCFYQITNCQHLQLKSSSSLNRHPSQPPVVYSGIKHLSQCFNPDSATGNFRCLSTPRRGVEQMKTSALLFKVLFAEKFSPLPQSNGDSCSNIVCLQTIPAERRRKCCVDVN